LVNGDFFHTNFPKNPGAAQAKAKELLMELDYERSEATRANLEKPGAWLGFMNPQRFTKMMEIWNEIELKLRGACNALIARPGGASRWGVSGKRLSVARSARWGASSTPAEIYSKPPSERLLRVIFHRKTAKMGI
jgi:hypothetical protein